MAIKRRTSTKERAPKADDDEKVRLAAWLNDFDAKQADLAAKLDALLRSLGVDPARASNASVTGTHHPDH
jgi:hypothetical protein